jgi:hypothetical protein
MQIRLDVPCGQVPAFCQCRCQSHHTCVGGVATTAGSVDRDALAAETSVGHIPLRTPQPLSTLHTQHMYTSNVIERLTMHRKV